MPPMSRVQSGLPLSGGRVCAVKASVPVAKLEEQLVEQGAYNPMIMCLSPKEEVCLHDKSLWVKVSAK